MGEMRWDERAGLTEKEILQQTPEEVREGPGRRARQVEEAARSGVLAQRESSGLKTNKQTKNTQQNQQETNVAGESKQESVTTKAAVEKGHGGPCVVGHCKVNIAFLAKVAAWRQLLTTIVGFCSQSPWDIIKIFSSIHLTFGLLFCDKCS